MQVEVQYVIEVENSGMRRMFGPVTGFAKADETAMGMRQLDPVSIIRVHRINRFGDAKLPIPPSIDPNQTTVDEQIASHVPDIHDHVG